MKTKTIRWKHRPALSMYEGFSDDVLCFTMDNNTLYDARGGDKFSTVYRYPITSILHGKSIAKDLLNSLNKEVHEKSRLDHAEIKKKESKRFQDLMNKTDALIKKHEELYKKHKPE